LFLLDLARYRRLEYFGHLVPDLPTDGRIITGLLQQRFGDLYLNANDVVSNSDFFAAYC